MKYIFGLVFVALITATVLGVLPVFVEAQEPGGFPRAARLEVDQFTYTISFKLADGTDAFIIRSRFQVLYYYRQQEPILRQHHISALIGFYYGKTALGRPLFSHVRVDRVSFFPIWSDSAGYSHNLFNKTSIAGWSGFVSDGQLIGSTLLVDKDPLSQYIPRFGGLLVMEGLRFTLNSGQEVSLANESIIIRLEKENRRILPNAAMIENPDDLDFFSDNTRLTISTAIHAPTILTVDMAIAISLTGAGMTFLTLIVLHMKGIYTKFFEKIRSQFGIERKTRTSSEKTC